MQDLHINIYSSAHKQNQPILGYHQVRGFDEKSEISNRTVYMVHSNSLRKSKLSSVSCPHMSFNMKIIWLSVQLDFFFFFFFFPFFLTGAPHIIHALLFPIMPPVMVFFSSFHVKHITFVHSTSPAASCPVPRVTKKCFLPIAFAAVWRQIKIASPLRPSTMLFFSF